MQIYKIDENGYFLEDVILKKDEEIPNDCVEIQPPQGLYKARWTGVEWIEDMTQEEIDALNNQPTEPTTEQLVSQQKDLAIKLIAPMLPDEALIQVPLLFDEWVSGVEYVADKSVVRYEDVLYRVITSHRSQADWPPSDVPALYKIIEAPGEIGPWRQPLGEHDAYQTGDKVTHKDKTWISTADNNVWEPGIHGWEIAT